MNLEVASIESLNVAKYNPRKDLKPTDEPIAEFDYSNGTVYAYCNLHGLWKA